jgi:hypothetical protein
LYAQVQRQGRNFSEDSIGRREAERKGGNREEVLGRGKAKRQMATAVVLDCIPHGEQAGSPPTTSSAKPSFLWPMVLDSFSNVLS